LTGNTETVYGLCSILRSQDGLPSPCTWPSGCHAVRHEV